MAESTLQWALGAHWEPHRVPRDAGIPCSCGQALGEKARGCWNLAACAPHGSHPGEGRAGLPKLSSWPPAAEPAAIKNGAGRSCSHSQEREQRKPQPRGGWQHPRGITSTGRGWAFPRGEPSGAGSASPAASGCNQCLQNWRGSFPASSQVRCFPQEAEPIAPCAGVLHVRCSRLWPQQLPRRGVRAPRTPSRCPGVQQQRAAGLWGLQNLGCEKQSK